MTRPLTLVLGSGGARGCAFVGALRALESSGLHVAHVVGSSMGALIGAGHCSGRSAADLEAAASHFTWTSILRPDLTGPALVSHRGLEAIVSELVPAKRFDELSVPLTVTCTDIQTGRAAVFTRGLLVPPVVGSCLAAGVFTPVRHEGRWLVDGGYTDPVPVSLAPAGSVVVALDPSAVPDWTLDLSPRRPWLNLVKGGRVARQVRKSADTLIFALGRERLKQREHILIAPALGTMTFMDFDRASWAIERGYEATMAAIPEIRRAVGVGE